MRETDILIVGAGPSGLSLAYHLQGDTLVLEKEDRVGGLCRSIEHGAGVFDIGGHSFHTPYPEVEGLVRSLMDGQLFSQRRDAWVYTCGTLIPYPFQEFFDQIPDPRVVEECRIGLSNTGHADQAGSFEEYIVLKFGQGVADHFLLPYNRKLWAHDLGRISYEWTSERIAAPKGAQERFDTRGGKRNPLQSDTRVAYPIQGGYEEIYKRFVPHLPALELGQEVVYIDPAMRMATTSTGSAIHWRRLVSTMPLPNLLRIMDGTPPKLIDLADRLEYNSLHVLLLLTDRQIANVPQRVYVADPAVPPHKIAFNHNSSDHLRRRPVHAITAEISYSPEKPLDDPLTLERKSIEFLVTAGMLNSRRDIVWTGHVDVRFAYPVYTHERPAILQTLDDYLRQLGIYTLGRFGEWQYINSDRCIKRGMDLAEELRRDLGCLGDPRDVDAAN